MTAPAKATCPQCGGDFADGSLCTYCHQGIRFAGEGFAFTNSPLTCPECEGALHQIDYHGVTIDTCGQCEGAWFDVGEIEQVVQAARTATKAGSFVSTPGDPATAGAPPKRARAYLACPKCQKLMNRQNWEHRSGVVVDWCKSCGVWLDGGELAQMRSWAAQTPDGPPPPPKEPEPRPQAAQAQSILMQDVGTYGTLGGSGYRPAGQSLLGDLLTSLLWSIFR